MKTMALIIGVFLLGVGLFVSYSRGQELKKNGTIINRSFKYKDEEETFTVFNADWTTVSEKVSTLKFPVSKKVDIETFQEEKAFLFASHDGMMDPYIGLLELVGKKGEAFLWRFHFTSYRDKSSDASMNGMLTSIELMFLEIDINTTVKCLRIKRKSKADFF